VFKYKSIVIQSGVYHVQSVTQVLVTISWLPKCLLQLQIVISLLVFFISLVYWLCMNVSMEYRRE